MLETFRSSIIFLCQQSCFCNRVSNESQLCKMLDLVEVEEDYTPDEAEVENTIREAVMGDNNNVNPNEQEVEL